MTGWHGILHGSRDKSRVQPKGILKRGFETHGHPERSGSSCGLEDSERKRAVLSLQCRISMQMVFPVAFTIGRIHIQKRNGFQTCGSISLSLAQPSRS